MDAFGLERVLLLEFGVAMQKVLVIGTSGSGKSTLAGQVGIRLGLPYIPTDPLYWGKNWRQVPLAEVHERVVALSTQPQWVLDGNFDDVFETVWVRADVIVWLDYPRQVVWPRLLRRNLGWWLSGTPTWSGNRMTFRMALSGVRHGLRSYRLKRRTYPAMLECLPAARVLRFRRPRDAAGWLKGLET